MVFRRFAKRLAEPIALPANSDYGGSGVGGSSVSGSSVSGAYSPACDDVPNVELDSPPKVYSPHPSQDRGSPATEGGGRRQSRGTFGAGSVGLQDADVCWERFHCPCIVDKRGNKTDINLGFMNHNFVFA